MRNHQAGWKKKKKNQASIYRKELDITYLGLTDNLEAKSIVIDFITLPCHPGVLLLIDCFLRLD